MEVNSLKNIIDSARGKRKADFVIKNCRIVNVLSHEITEGDIAITDGIIVGTGSYSGIEETDAAGAYAIPGLIEGHIHIESSFTTPEEFSALMVPYGTTTAIADPHEITNVCGLKGFKYMIEASKNAAMDIKYMVPSCVPCTPFEDSGETVSAEDIERVLGGDEVLGLGELMDFVGVLNCNEEVLKKVSAVQKAGKYIDGHAPGVKGKDRLAYISAGVRTDHECSTIEEFNESVSNGMYVALRDGSASNDLVKLVKGITEQNSRRCFFCSDDRQPVTVFDKGDLDNHLRICVSNGIDPITAVQMGTINAAECYGLTDRGSLTPGKRADIVLMKDLKDFEPLKVFIKGELVAENKKYLKEVKRYPIDEVMGSVHVKDFDIGALKLNIKASRVHAIEISSGSIVTKDSLVEVKKTLDGDFVFEKDKDVAKIAVLERHHEKGFIGLGLIKGYGIKKGAIALTIGHDSHNILCVGVSNEEMYFAVQKIKEQSGGIVLVNEGKVVESMPLPVAGLMSDQSSEWVSNKLEEVNEAAFNILGVNKDIEPVSQLCFMALPVIPELKITDRGLFDVRKFDFIDINA